MGIEHRMWLEFERQNDRYPDGLTGTATDDPLIQEHNRETADGVFRGSVLMPGPKVPQPQADAAAVEKARRWQRKRIQRYRESIAATDAAEISETLVRRVAGLACDRRKAEGFDRQWLRHEIDEAIRLERQTATLQPDEETLAEIIQAMKELR